MWHMLPDVGFAGLVPPPSHRLFSIDHLGTCHSSFLFIMNFTGGIMVSIFIYVFHDDKVQIGKV